MLTETIEAVPTRSDQQHFAQALVEQARSEGVELIGPGGLFTGLTKTVLDETATGPDPKPCAGRLASWSATG